MSITDLSVEIIKFMYVVFATCCIVAGVGFMAMAVVHLWQRVLGNLIPVTVVREVISEARHQGRPLPKLDRAFRWLDRLKKSGYMPWG